MSILYKNKTIKDPFHIPEPNSYQKKSSGYIGKGERFSDRIQNSPGPGSYEFKSNNFRIPDYQVIKKRNQSSQLSKQYQWLMGSNRTSYLNHQPTSLGPGSYELHPKLSPDKGKWNKSERFHQRQHTGLNIGPGSYQNLKKSPSKVISSVFKSRSPKSFIQQLGSEASQKKLKKTTERAPIFENPELQNSQKEQNFGKKSTQKKKNHKNSVFASKIPRFQQNSKQMVSDEIGPGSYEVEVNHTKESLPKIISIKNQTRVIPKKPQKPNPGPGYYEANQQTIGKTIEEKGNLISKEERFHQSISEESPGPGHYMQNKFTYMVDLKKKINPQRPSFLSSSERSQLELNSKANPFGAYNLGLFDMEYRMKKKQQHIEKLKIMEVSLPAFNTKSKK